MKWRSRRPLSRSMLLGVVLAAAVFLGLLTMHGHTGTGLTAPVPATVHVSTTQTPAESDGLRVTETTPSCVGCLESGAGLLMVCMFALLITLGIIIPPGRFLLTTQFKSWRTLALYPRTSMVLRAPSLHMLCISRR